MFKNHKTDFEVSKEGITKGNTDVPSGGKLQQVLMYARKDDGTLHPLECLQDRLLVDVLELSASGRITSSTALSSMQVCGYSTGDNRFKTLRTTNNGELITSYREHQTISNNSSGTALSGSLGIGVATESIDILHHNAVHFLLSDIGGGISLSVQGSHDNSNFFNVAEFAPASALGGGTLDFRHKITSATYRYYRVINDTGGAPITFTNMIFTKINV